MEPVFSIKNLEISRINRNFADDEKPVDMKILLKTITVTLTMVVATMMVTACNKQTTNVEELFVKVETGHFVTNGKPYYYVGTNFWYGAILGSEGQGGNRDRLCRELDEMKRMGIDNLRILWVLTVSGA